MPIIAGWYFHQWGHRVPGETEARSLERLEEYLHRDRIPFILVGLVNADICAVAQLKYREMADIYPEKEHWLGGVFVPEEHRNRGYGGRMAEQIATLAPSYGVKTLYLQTDRLDGGIYSRLGWHPIERVNNRGLEVLVMERQLD